MNYEELENAGELEIDFTGSLLDLHTLGILHINMLGCFQDVKAPIHCKEICRLWRQKRKALGR